MTPFELPLSETITVSSCQRRAHRCFLEKGFQSEVCGNGILDAAEECDPGIGNLHTDPCCQSNCGLRPRAQCSFRNSPCCTPNCTIAPATQECYPKGESYSVTVPSLIMMVMVVVTLLKLMYVLNMQT